MAKLQSPNEVAKTKRQKKLDKIMTSIAAFIVSETYTDESEAQDELSQTLKHIESAQSKLKGE